MALWQLMHLGTWCNRTSCAHHTLCLSDVTVHHVPKRMSCHKAIVVITGRRAHCLSFSSIIRPWPKHICEEAFIWDTSQNDHNCMDMIPHSNAADERIFFNDSQKQNQVSLKIRLWKNFKLHYEDKNESSWAITIMLSMETGCWVTKKVHSGKYTSS